MKKLTICLPILNQLNDIKPALALFRHNTNPETEWMIIDNGSTEPVEPFIRTFIKPKKLNYIRNNENIGMVKTMQQAYENCETEILAVTHSDVFVYEKDWDQRMLRLFEDMPKLGGIGFFGAQGCGPNGERIQDVKIPGQMAGMSNLLEAEIHGMRLEEEFKPCAIFDGFMTLFRMEMLKKGGGFDQRYLLHHFYDRSAGLQSLALGYQNIVVNVPCHHVSGLTANRSDYQLWVQKKLDRVDADKFTHDSNMELFKKIWNEVLPVYVEGDFSFRAGQQGQWDFKGDKIVGFDWQGNLGV